MLTQFLKFFAVYISVICITALMNGAMKRKQFKVHPMGNIISMIIMTTVFILIDNLSEWTIYGIVFSWVLMYASIEDYTKKEVDDSLWVMILLLSLGNIGKAGILYMLGGALVLFIPSFIMLFSRRIGGADVKIAAATGLFLGFWGAVIGFIIGLVVAILWNTVYKKIKHMPINTSFPMVPYLSCGIIIGYFI